MRLRDLRDILENSVARNIKSYWRNRRNEVIQVCIKEIKVKIPMKKKFDWFARGRPYLDKKRHPSHCGCGDNNCWCRLKGNGSFRIRFSRICRRLLQLHFRFLNYVTDVTQGKHQRLNFFFPRHAVDRKTYRTWYNAYACEYLDSISTRVIITSSVLPVLTTWIHSDKLPY